RTHKTIGHLLQGRYKPILCETDRYLAELIRYIHLNPLRAKIVRNPEQYQYSSHRAYARLEKEHLVDADPVLRHFGGRKRQARERFSLFVRAGMRLGHQEEFYERKKAGYLVRKNLLPTRNIESARYQEAPGLRPRLRDQKWTTRR